MTPNLEHLSTSLPEQKNYEVAYGLAFQLAADKLCNYEDLVEYCQRSESIYQISGTSQSVRLKYLGKPLYPYRYHYFKTWIVMREVRA